MKKILFACTIVMALVSCSGSGNSKNSTTDTGYKDINGVENVNGNIPDTNATGATPHTDKLPKDSMTTKAMADSLH